jgi:hypothetical protein
MQVEGLGGSSGVGGDLTRPSDHLPWGMMTYEADFRNPNGWVLRDKTGNVVARAERRDNPQGGYRYRAKGRLLRAAQDFPSLDLAIAHVTEAVYASGRSIERTYLPSWNDVKGSKPFLPAHGTPRTMQ